MVTSFSLLQNYPNPFNPNTTIGFSLPNAENVSLKVYTLLGEQVAELVNRRLEAGIHRIDWNAANMPNGVYLYVLKAGNYREVRKAILMK